MMWVKLPVVQWAEGESVSYWDEVEGEMVTQPGDPVRSGVCGMWINLSQACTVTAGNDKSTFDIYLSGGDLITVDYPESVMEAMMTVITQPTADNRAYFENCLAAQEGTKCP